MLSKEAFKQIGEASSDEERLILCQLHDVSLEWFTRLWPAEQLGVDVLEHRALIIRIECQFESLGAFFDKGAEGPRYKRTLAIQYKRYEYEHLNIGVNPWLRMTPYITISPVTTICVDADQVPPSLQDTIDLF